MWNARSRYRKDGSRARRNVWHETLMQTYSDAAWDWWQRRDTETNGCLGSDEENDFRLAYPCPQLKEFMIRLSWDWRRDDNYIEEQYA